jgi:hypothetical protein
MNGPASDPVRRPAAVYGLIEWDGSYQPTVTVGCCINAVMRDIIAIFTALIATGGAIGSPEFREQHPLPDPHAPGEVLAGWIDALHADTTVPYVTLMDAAQLVRTGPNLLVVDRTAVNGFYSRDTTARPGPQSAPAAPAAPTVVNGYPVVAAVAENEDTSSWIVICRRTERLPDNAARYVTWRAWHADGRWHSELGDYGPGHALTWAQAQQSLLRRLDLLSERTHT